MLFKRTLLIVCFACAHSFAQALVQLPCDGSPIESSGMSQIAEGMNNVPLGVFDLGDGKKGFAMLVTGIARDKNRVWFYLPDGEADDGGPVFKKVDFFSLPPELELSGKRMLSRNCAVFKSSDGSILGFWNVGDELHRSKLDIPTMKFISIGKPLKVPGFRGIVECGDGSFLIYSRGSVQIRPPAEGWLDTWTSVKRGVPYYPFDGMGAWRGGERRQFLFVQKLDSLTGDSLSKPLQATPSKEEGIILNRVSPHFEDAQSLIGKTSNSDAESGLSGGTGKKAEMTHEEMEDANKNLACQTPSKDAESKRSIFVGTDSGNIIHYTIRPDGTLDRSGLCRQGGIALRTPAIATSCAVYAGDGKPNLLIGGECGIYYYKFRSYSKDGIPEFDPPIPVRQNGGRIYCGTLPVVSCADWDGDGLADIVAGNSLGEVVWFKNVGRRGMPAFTEPKRMLLDGEPFSEKGGYLNLQGPGEAHFGYVCPTVYDWDGDGLYDLITGDNSSRFGVYFNKGDRRSENFRARKPLYCNGVDLHGAWRQRPGVAKLSNGKVGYVILDDDNQLRMYWKMDSRNLEDRGKLKLVDGSPIGSYEVRSGETGRLKFMLADVDGDGKTDILVGAIASCAMPEPKRGIPRNLKGDARKTGVLWLKNVGDDDNPVFEYPRLMRMKQHKQQGLFTSFGWHSCSASVADFGGRQKGILVGSEEGEIYFFRFSDILWEDYDSLERR